MSILSWILCYFGIGSEEGDIREEEREAREGRGSNKNQTKNNSKPQNNRSTKPSGTQNRGTQTRTTQKTSSAPERNRGKRNVTLVAANGDEIEFICYGIVSYRGKNYACMELIESDDDGVLFFEYTVTRGGEENYSMVDDDRLVDKLLAEANRTLSR